MKKSFIIGLIIIACLVILAGVLRWLYAAPLTDLKTKVFATIPLPAALVNMRPITVSLFLDRLEIAQTLYGHSGIQPSVKKQALDTVINEAKLQQLSSSHAIVLTKDDLSVEYKAIVKALAQGDEERFKTILADNYHMDVRTFQNNVLKPELLETKLQIWYNDQPGLNSDAHASMQAIQDKLKNGTDFSILAKEYTQNAAGKPLSGDLGFIAMDDLLPEFSASLTSMNIGETRLVTSRYGRHLLKLLGMDASGPQGVKRLHLQEIFIENTRFSNWYQEQLGNIKVIKFFNI